MLKYPLNNSWERFSGGPVRSPRERIHATIGPKLRILLNAKLYQMIGEPREVVLYFNRQTSKIAIDPVFPGVVPGAFPVIERRGSFEIQAASFCRHHRINVRSTHKFQSPQVTAEGRLILNLTRTTHVTRRKRRRETTE